MSEVKPGDEIVVTKWIALKGSSELAKAGREELEKRYPAKLIDRAAGFEAYLSTREERRIAEAFACSDIFEMGDGGVFGALWEMGERHSLGLEVDLRLIPIRQETVEIFNHLDKNPYMYDSTGSLLFAASNGGKLVRDLLSAEINAAVIGTFTAGNDRIVKNRDRVRYLTPPHAG